MTREEVLFYKKLSLKLLLWVALIMPTWGCAYMRAGIGKANITPPLDTPSAGYRSRHGQGMQGIHDPLEAIALFIDNGEKKIVLCSVDHLGFTYEMVQSIIKKVHEQANLSECEIYIGSSHTHSGGGAYLNIPSFGENLCGPYNPQVTHFYIDQTVKAIIQATQNPTLAKIGIGYGKAESLAKYRGQWPIDVIPLDDVAIIKVTEIDGTPIAVLFNYPIHPTIMKAKNRLFSADFVGYARNHLQAMMGSNVQPIYFNGAQAEIVPAASYSNNQFESCASLAQSLAKTVKDIWDKTAVEDTLEITTQSTTYELIPQATPYDLLLPMESYTSEVGILVFNQKNAFITIPGELSCLYDKQLKEAGRQLGFTHASIFGLTNDAHGYIILPESWAHKTFESATSFGGKNYGEETKQRAIFLLKEQAPH